MYQSSCLVFTEPLGLGIMQPDKSGSGDCGDLSNLYEIVWLASFRIPPDVVKWGLSEGLQGGLSLVVFTGLFFLPHMRNSLGIGLCIIAWPGARHTVGPR